MLSFSNLHSVFNGVHFKASEADNHTKISMSSDNTYIEFLIVHDKPHMRAFRKLYDEPLKCSRCLGSSQLDHKHRFGEADRQALTGEE